MSLKSSIVVVNQYTLKTGSKSGSRGGTPGDYVMRYMARDRASEDLTPVRLFDADTYVTRYMARKNASETLGTIPEIKDAMRDSQKFGGLAFGYGDISLSDEGLRFASEDIQKNFDKGKTVLKTVLSFDEAYLKEHGLVDEDFHLESRGDYRGNLDQLKLRMAIMSGLNKMGRHYSDLQYVGVIQVDTEHVHCHLAMVDRGRGHIMPDGTQRGKITAKDKAILRRGIDDFLDQKQQVKLMGSAVAHGRRNALCHIKKFTHKTMARQGLPQFLISCLPANRNYWRASTNRKDMRKANAIVRDFVVGVLRQAGSGFEEASEAVEQYASHRREREGLSELEYNKLVRDGQNRIVEDCMNGVYAVLKQIPQDQLRVRTPMLDLMSMDYDEMAGQAVNSKSVEFGFKLRSYSARLSHHRSEYHKYRDAARSYEADETKVAESAPMGDFFRQEANYNAMLMVKYQYFLSFLPPDENIEEEFDRLMRQKERLKDLQDMRDDPSFQRMDPEAAEEYGVQVYGQRGGRRIRSAPQLLERRIERLGESVARQEDDFRAKLHDYGMDYDGQGVTRRKMFEFDDVKALDLHHMGYDFPYNARISKPNVDAFVEAANRRYESFTRAKSYLIASGQAESVRELPEKDILFMKEYADRLPSAGEVASERPESGQFRHSMTIRLGPDYLQDMEAVVESTLRSEQIVNEIEEGIT